MRCYSGMGKVLFCSCEKRFVKLFLSLVGDRIKGSLCVIGV